MTPRTSLVETLARLSKERGRALERRTFMMQHRTLGVDAVENVDAQLRSIDARMNTVKQQLEKH